MIRRFRPVLALAATILVLFSVAAISEPDVNVDKAGDFIKLLSKGDFNGAYQKLDGNLGFNLKAEKLAEVWKGLTAKAGNFVEIQESKVESVQNSGLEYKVVTNVCKFEKGLMDIKVAIDPMGRVADFKYSNHKGS